MAHLPKTGSLVIEHEINEDCGINRFNFYTMINSIIDRGVEVYILKSDNDDYIAVTHSRFEHTHLAYSEGFNDEVLEPKMSVVDLNNKSIRRLTHSNKDIIVQFNVYENFYEITLTDKSSDKVFSDLVNELNVLITKENYKKFIGKRYKYKVKWNKDKYEWIRL